MSPPPVDGSYQIGRAVSGLVNFAQRRNCADRGVRARCTLAIGPGHHSDLRGGLASRRS